MLLMNRKKFTPAVLGTILLAAALLAWGNVDGVGEPMARADEKPRDDSSAKQILDHVAKTYADCKSYRDSGVVKTVFVQQDGNRTEEKSFTTAFVRPDRYRFEFTDATGKRPVRPLSGPMARRPKLGGI